MKEHQVALRTEAYILPRMVIMQSLWPRNILMLLYTKCGLFFKLKLKIAKFASLK